MTCPLLPLVRRHLGWCRGVGGVLRNPSPCAESPGHWDEGRSRPPQPVARPQNAVQALLLFLNWVFSG